VVRRLITLFRHCTNSAARCQVRYPRRGDVGSFHVLYKAQRCDFSLPFPAEQSMAALPPVHHRHLLRECFRPVPLPLAAMPAVSCDLELIHYRRKVCHSATISPCVQYWHDRQYSHRRYPVAISPHFPAPAASSYS